MDLNIFHFVDQYRFTRVANINRKHQIQPNDERISFILSGLFR